MLVLYIEFFKIQNLFSLLQGDSLITSSLYIYKKKLTLKLGILTFLYSGSKNLLCIISAFKEILVSWSGVHLFNAFLKFSLACLKSHIFFLEI